MMTPNSNRFAQKSQRKDIIFAFIGMAVLFAATLTLSLLLIDLFSQAAGRLSWSFMSSFPSRFAEKAGILSAWSGTVFIIILTTLFAVPLGILTAVYLEEYAKKNAFYKFVELNIYNLAGVPSIVFGVTALGIFVYFLRLGHSVLTASLTLTLLILPIVVIATREALKTVPQSIREAAYALGSAKYQTVFFHVVPYSMGGILTGIIIAISRAIGETAPLIAVGAVAYIAFIPTAPTDPYTALPIQMFNWISRPQAEFHVNAAAAGAVLILLTFMLNGFAIYIRTSFRKRFKW